VVRLNDVLVKAMHDKGLRVDIVVEVEEGDLEPAEPNRGTGYGVLESELQVHGPPQGQVDLCKLAPEPVALHLEGPVGVGGRNHQVDVS